MGNLNWGGKKIFHFGCKSPPPSRGTATYYNGISGDKQVVENGVFIKKMIGQAESNFPEAVCYFANCYRGQWKWNYPWKMFPCSFSFSVNEHHIFSVVVLIHTTVIPMGMGRGALNNFWCVHERITSKYSKLPPRPSICKVLSIWNYLWKICFHIPFALV